MILFQLLILLLLLYFVFLISYSLLRGAPYAPIGKKRLNAMFELMQVEKGKKLVDLGSGDGRIVSEASRRGIKAYGFEINPVLVLIAKFKLRNLQKPKPHIVLCDIYAKDLSEFDYVTIYGTSYMVRFLENKLKKELKTGAKVVSNHFRFPHWKVAKQKDDVYLYIKR